ncbi:imelysin family protein [Mucilaginibacter sabulilitoris]|uniref:Imelysin family protein n=1 Tax=Mucilaginibacter sabulilitoris TaxID=1173583 RepID=A0ABZ0TS83_9SPHI|nr:imelysin family protein [Mucilaginibacter sabulilitoris]WPU95317.1 imelysin family protein [Mucilaginibacter sabulilitoris]
MRKFIYTALIAVSAFVLIQSCSKSNSGSGPADGGDKGSSFDRKGMLTNLSTNIIIPAYTAFQTSVTNLDAAVTAFNTAPNATTLVAAQTAFKASYLQWQSTSEFDFGPAADVTLRANTNTYPLDVGQVNDNITAGTYDPDFLKNLSAKGLPALDYLLFGTGVDNNAILLQYTSDAKAANRKAYLAKLSAELKTNITKVTAAWNGAYKATFLNATGTDVGSSTGQLINQLVFDYEILKNYEIGIPAGVQSMGTTFPEKVQAYNAKISVQLALAHLQAILDIYTGKDGIGLDDYLISAKAKASDGSSLNDTILKQFATAKTKLQILKDPLSDNIKNNNAAVTAAYTELQKLTVLLKTDMTSSLGILITYGDNDGD